MKTILVCGSREWEDYTVVYIELLREVIAQGWADVPIRVIHGACRGADRLAAIAAHGLGYEVTPFPADWSRGRRAGPERNARMLDENPDLVIAFGHGRGTDGMVRMAERRGVPVRRFGA